MEPIYVTKTFLPPFEEFIEKISTIWDTHLVTNDGPLFKEFEERLREYTGIEHLVCMGNGTLALQIALRALDLPRNSEVITTPFTHVASSSSLIWEGYKTVYADIDPETFNIDPVKVEEKINKNTSAILAVHVYSNPCDVETLADIAKKYNLKLIYDAAHAFGVNYNGISIMAYGDLSMTSLNATKAMHSFEGGVLFAHDENMVKQLRRLAYFGLDESKTNIVQKYGINAKLIEVCAAMGILNLNYFNKCTEHRKHLYELYINQLSTNHRIRFQKLTGEINYSYMPIILESEGFKYELLKYLNSQNIYPREYFKPTLEPTFNATLKCKIASEISNRVLCLPLSNYLSDEEVKFICCKINEI